MFDSSPARAKTGAIRGGDQIGLPLIAIRSSPAAAANLNGN
jgi:hypothetical protein